MSAGETGDQLDMGGPAKLVDDLHPVEPVACGGKGTGIAGEGDRVAGDGGDDRDLRLRQAVGLRLCPGAGRVDDGSGER